MTIRHRKLTIFEGPDGGGKTTAAKQFASDTGALYLHHGPLPLMDRGLARVYVESMLPALHGTIDVVMDRAWHSEVPYGVAFRGGRDRLGNESRRMLERLAMRMSTMVVRCLPEWKTVVTNYCGRKDLEMLENEEQLRLVYDNYRGTITELPCLSFDYEQGHGTNYILDHEDLRTHAHRLDVRSAGNLGAKVVLVGQAFADHKDHDPHYQWPFASFSGHGCSRWLATELWANDISEADLLWVNADQPLDWLGRLSQDFDLVAMGINASETLVKHKWKHHKIPHPQSWKRFNASQEYPLIPLVRSLLDAHAH